MSFKKKQELRSFVLVSATPSRRFCRCSVIVSGLSGQVMGTLWSWARFTHGGNSGVITTPVLFALGMFPQLLFQGVSPVTLSCSWSIALWNCCLNAGSTYGFLMGLVLVGGSPLPLPPLPDCQSLWGVVAHSYCPHAGMIQYKIGDWWSNICPGGDDILYFLLWRLFHQDQHLTKYELVDLLIFDWLRPVIAKLDSCAHLLFLEVLQLICYS